MIRTKTPKQIDKMATAGALVGECHALARSMAKPGATTAEINAAVEKLIESRGAIAAFKGVKGAPGVQDFPFACCMSVDERVVHGFPNDTPLREGQILSVDIGTRVNGWYGDAARTFIIGEKVDPRVKELVDVTEAALYEGIRLMLPGNYLTDIGHAIQTYVEARGFSVVRDLVGHGIGQNLHEEPQVPNYGEGRRGLKLREGMVLAVEPMINLGTWKVKVLDDGWTVVTQDGQPSAHFEHTIAITKDGPRILTPEPEQAANW
ncbi:type I methionyl aminopeptidase [bacterium]|nr:type I methionyl aminopeptidase [bacterium]